MRIDPHTTILQAWREQNLTWDIALSELIDNAFDANASTVTITLKDRRLVVEDDGEGAEDIGSFVRLGEHRGHGRKGLGRYGVGAKDATAFFGGRVEITTWRGGRRSELTFDMDAIEQSGTWEITDPIHAWDGHATGTRLVYGKLAKSRSAPRDACVANLAKTYSPALIAGKSIVFVTQKRKPLIAAPLPKLKEAVADSFAVNGKDVSIYIGIVAEENQPHERLRLIHGYRVLDETSMGMRGYSGENIRGEIVLGSAWRLAKNKNAITDEDAGLLADEIYSRIEPLLKRSDEMATDVICNEMLAEVAMSINEGVGAIRQREKRDRKQESVGAVIPKQTGRTRKRAAKGAGEGDCEIQTGGGKARGFSAAWVPIDSDTLGTYDKYARRVSLNSNHPLLIQARADKNAAVWKLASAVILASFDARNDGDQRLLKYAQRDDVELAAGKIVASII